MGLLISLTRRLVWMTASRKLEEAGHSMISWALVGFLMNFGPTTQRDIAAGIGQHPAGVSRLIDDLESEGYVRRRRDEADRRRARVEVTARGKAMWTAAEPLVTVSLKEALSPLSLDEQKQLRKLLQKLVLSEKSPACDPRMVRVLRSINAIKSNAAKSAANAKKTVRKTA
ncbi:MAG: winged helix-turn-helix transcriptional regulator [Polyangiaceae bacterium]|nr:MarR family winged helix-turn-helix transcriptional regulator [Polyangiaceae bacterium]NUQ76413.1 winged helix-turn-helix transcriptional regulator [Polyangiaceae bacterium]